MKTDQLDRVTVTHEPDRDSRTLPRPGIPSQRPPTGDNLRRVALGVFVVLLTAVVAAGAWFAMTPTVEQPSVQAAPLFDLSIRARDHAAPAPTVGQDTLLDRTIRAREPAAAVPPQVWTHYRSIRAHDHAATMSPRDSLLRQSIRARER